MRLRTDKQFRAEHQHKIPNPPAAFLTNTYACKLEAFDYIPEGPKFILRDDELHMNLYKPSPLLPVKGDCSIMVNQFEYIFPDKKVLEHWLDYFAWILQFPDEKIKHCLLLISLRQGVGKSFFKILLERLLGAWNIVLIDSGSWMASFNSHHLNKQIGVIEELAIRKEVSAYNALKQYVTEDFIMAKEKHVTEYKARTPYGMIAFSNDPKPIVIEKYDRRFHVYETPVKPKDQAYYDKLFGVSDAELAAFKFFLLERDLSEFSPDAPPPMTEDKQRLIKQSSSPAKALLEEMIALKMPPFQNDVVTGQHIEAALKGQSGISDRQVELRNLRETLRQLDAVSLGQRSIDGQRYSLWAIRNAEKWKEASTTSIKEEFCKK